MTWGIARALAAAGGKGAIDAHFVDADREALDAAQAIARAAPPGAVQIDVTTRTARVGAAGSAGLPRADLVVLGQVVSELDVAAPAKERIAKHAALVQNLLDEVVAPDGALVIVEPALRDRTRHLHAVRDVLVAAGRRAFAPCPHAHACPALATEKEWCHEDLAVDLPEWLVPLARAAGLRFQGLTFSYLVLRPDGATMASRIDGGLRVRLVSELIRTKGKIEVFACTEKGERIRLRRLEREMRDGEEAEWDALAKGDFAALVGDVEGGRLGRDARIDVWRTRG
jgi:hypothetical protein